jgi:hypothetical protein
MPRAVRSGLTTRPAKNPQSDRGTPQRGNVFCFSEGDKPYQTCWFDWTIKNPVSMEEDSGTANGTNCQLGSDGVDIVV